VGRYGRKRGTLYIVHAVSYLVQRIERYSCNTSKWPHPVVNRLWPTSRFSLLRLAQTFAAQGSIDVSVPGQGSVPELYHRSNKSSRKMQRWLITCLFSCRQPLQGSGDAHTLWGVEGLRLRLDGSMSEYPGSFRVHFDNTFAPLPVTVGYAR